MVVGGKVCYSRRWQPGEKTDLSPKTHSPLLIRGQELLKASLGKAQTEGGAPCRTAQSARTVSLNLVTWCLISIVSAVLSAVHLHCQGWFVPFSLRPVLGTVAASVRATAWPSCS